jgi:hypothetical protein
MQQAIAAAPVDDVGEHRRGRVDQAPDDVDAERSQVT